VQSLPPSFADEIISILFQKMDEGLLREEGEEWDFNSVDENTWHGCLLTLADTAWHASIPPSHIPFTILYSLNVKPP
jgi:hypothetical protein